MNLKHYVGKRVSNLDLYDEIGPITGVAMLLDDENEIFSGDESGYVLEVECPYATQAMADAVLASVSNGTYKGYRAPDASLGVDAELGDGVTINGIYSMLAYQRLNFGPGHMSEIAAPGENVVDHEYPYISPEERKAQRARNSMWSAIKKNAESITLEVGELRTYTDDALEELVKEFGTSLGDLENDIFVELKKYSTIEMTNSSISSAVSESKTYTNTKTGEVVAQLSNYSTIEQTASKISSAVSESKSYTDSKTSAINTELKKYSTIEQTSSSISSAVSESKQYTDTKTGAITSSLSNYSTIQQTASSISAAVTESKQYTDGKYSTLSSSITQTATDITALINGVDGKYSSVKQTVDGLSVETVNGKTIIDGGNISTKNLVLTGAISWSDLDSTVQSAINAQPSLPGYIKSTYIDANSVQSFAILGNRIEAVVPYSVYNGIASDGSLMGFVLTGAYNDMSLAYMQIYSYKDAFGTPIAVFTSPNSVYASWEYPSTDFTGQVQFYGDVHFSGKVTGVPAVFG